MNALGLLLRVLYLLPEILGVSLGFFNRCEESSAKVEKSQESLKDVEDLMAKINVRIQQNWHSFMAKFEYAVVCLYNFSSFAKVLPMIARFLPQQG
jgi:hypothetical protein